MPSTMDPNHVVKVAALSAKEGYVHAIGNKEHLCIPKKGRKSQRYELGGSRTIELHWKSMKFSPDHVYDDHLQGGNVVIFKYNIGKDHWKELLWMKSPPIVSFVAVNDLRTTPNNTKVDVQLMVDTTLRGDKSESIRKPFFLAAVTMVRKGNAAFYQSTPEKAKRQQKQYSHQYDDKQTLVRLKSWIYHHRSIGVERFYIIDNQYNMSLPGFLPQEDEENFKDVTWIRTNQTFGFLNACPDMTGVSQGGQLVLENALLFAANTEWLLSADFDEFAFPGKRFHSTLPPLIRHHGYKNDGSVKNITGIRLHPYFPCTTNRTLIIEEKVGTHEFIASYDDLLLRKSQSHRSKYILRPDQLLSFSIHFAFPEEKEINLRDNKDGYLAHLRHQKSFCGKRETLGTELVEDYRAVVDNIPQYP